MNSQGHRFDPWSGNQIPQVANKDPACYNKDPAQPNQLNTHKHTHTHTHTHTMRKKKQSYFLKNREKYSLYKPCKIVSKISAN